jgi:hypothetical protein
MSDQESAQKPTNHIMELPQFGKAPMLSMDMSSIRSAESRIIEAKMVNPATYADLESSYNEAYRDLKRYLSAIGYQIVFTEKALEEVKADIILDKYPLFLEEKGIKKTQDNADLRKAFMARDPDYQLTLDRLNQLRALESNFDGKIKVFENVCRYMRQKMQLLIRSGLSGANYHVTSGDR